MTRSTDLIVPLAGVLTVVALALFLERDVSDFRMFYDSGSAWRTGSVVYHPDHPNLQPPSVTAAVFAPLSRLPYRSAQVVWLIASALSFVATVRLIGLTLRLPPWTLGALVLLPAWGIWFQGQVIWLLLYPCTRAWLAARSRGWARAGLWLAPVIAVKPPFALLALVLPLPCLLAAGGLSAALSGLTVPLTGWAAWRDWIAFGGAVRWLSWPENASLWGVVSRWQSGQLLGGSVAEIPGVAMGAIAVAGLLGAWRCARERDPDRRVSLALLFTVLLSPLGWTAYLPLGAGPFAACWSHRAWGAYALLCLPLPLLYPLLGAPWMVRTLGSIYALGAVIAWGTLQAGAEADREHDHQQRQQAELQHPV